MTIDTAGLRELIEKALDEDPDHFVATGDDLTWLLAQVAYWPTRVDQDRTTNDRFCRLSIVVSTLALLDRVQVLEKALGAARDWLDDEDTFSMGPAEQHVLHELKRKIDAALPTKDVG